MASILIEAITEFGKEEQPQYLRLIHVVVYEEALMDPYKEEMKQVANTSMLILFFIKSNCINHQTLLDLI